jgi:hypothetical protein
MKELRSDSIERIKQKKTELVELLNKFKLKFKELFFDPVCSHTTSELIEWRVLADDNNMPMVRVTSKCEDCEETFSWYLNGRDASDWIDAMKDYKRAE